MIIKVSIKQGILGEGAGVPSCQSRPQGESYFFRESDVETVKSTLARQKEWEMKMI
jgi:hypothetical protein